MGGIKLKNICQDCKGSGQYVGLTCVDKCNLCAGSGYFEEVITLEEYISVNNIYPVKEGFVSCEDEDEEYESSFDEVMEMYLDSLDALVKY